jgi:hypothetical protein
MKRAACHLCESGAVSAAPIRCASCRKQSCPHLAFIVEDQLVCCDCLCDDVAALGSATSLRRLGDSPALEAQPRSLGR